MAATNINVVVLTGNLTRDPELRSLPSGMSVCSLRPSRLRSAATTSDANVFEWPLGAKPGSLLPS